MHCLCSYADTCAFASSSPSKRLASKPKWRIPICLSCPVVVVVFLWQQNRTVWGDRPVLQTIWNAGYSTCCASKAHLACVLRPILHPFPRTRHRVALRCEQQHFTSSPSGSTLMQRGADQNRARHQLRVLSGSAQLSSPCRARHVEHHAMYMPVPVTCAAQSAYSGVPGCGPPSTAGPPKASGCPPYCSGGPPYLYQHHHGRIEGSDTVPTMPACPTTPACPGEQTWNKRHWCQQ
jgi:hypothetical protein